MRPLVLEIAWGVGSDPSPGGRGYGNSPGGAGLTNMFHHLTALAILANILVIFKLEVRLYPSHTRLLLGGPDLA